MLATKADVIACQEAGDQHKVIGGFLRSFFGWAAYAPRDELGQGGVPILVRTTKVGEFVGTVHQLVPKQRLVPILARKRGAGPKVVKPRVATVVDLGGWFVVNTHAIPSATRTKANLGEREWTARRKNYAQHMAALAALVGTLDGPVILCGDLNAEPDFPLLEPIKAAGFTGWTTEGTHGKRAIDHVLYRGNVTQGDRRTVKTTSDHRAVLSTLTVTLS